MTSGLPPEDRFKAFYILPGTRIGTYTVHRGIGHGGGQMAYLADAADGRRVVLKVSLSPRGEERSRNRIMHERFLRQITFFLKLRGSPGVAHVFAYDMHPDASKSGHLYMVQEWVPGSINILDWYRREPRSLEAIVAGWMVLANACGEMDRRGICHRDLKPDNVLMTPYGVPKIVDFNSGMSVGAEPLTSVGPGRWPGTRSYYSPEMCEVILSDWAHGERTPFMYRPAGDLHALGIIFYQVLTGEHPFDEHASDEELFEEIAYQVPERPRALNPEVPFPLEKVTLKLLQKDPDERYRSGDDVVRDLEALLGTGEDWSRPFQTPSRRRHSTPTSRTRTGGPPLTPRPRTAVGSAALNLTPSAMVLAGPRALAVRGSRALAVVDAVPAARSTPAARPPVPRRRVLLLATALALASVLALSWFLFVEWVGEVRVRDKEWLASCSPGRRKVAHDLNLEAESGLAWMVGGPNVVVLDGGVVGVRDGPVEVAAAIATPDQALVGRMHGEIRTGPDGASLRFTRFHLFGGSEPEGHPPSGPVLDICAIATVRGYGPLAEERAREPGIPRAGDPPPASKLQPGFVPVTTALLEIHFAQ